MFNTFLLTGLAILVMMVYLWLVSLKVKDASIVDPFWGVGFLVANYIYFVSFPNGAPDRKILLTVLLNLWALRLSVYLYLRNRRKGEDKRYQAWRKEAGKDWWWRSLINVFLLQGALMWVISVPLLAAQSSPQPEALTRLDWAAALVWLVGFLFETIGDWQLAAFKAQKKNQSKVMDRGLWRWTRHPNYFGESLIWWGYSLIAVAAGVWWALFSPLLMTFLLLRVSGVTMLETNLKKAKPGYANYVKRTSTFIPLPPRGR